MNSFIKIKTTFVTLDIDDIFQNIEEYVIQTLGQI